MSFSFSKERDMVRASFKKHSLKSISVPNAKNVDEVTYYQVDCSNGEVEWGMLIRFDNFATFHEEMVKVWEIRMSFQHLLPPFPEKMSKLFTDHLDPHFIRERRVLLDNYLKCLAKSSVWKTARAFHEFVTPAGHCLEAWAAKCEDVKKESPDTVVDEDALWESKEKEEDTVVECTHVRIPTAQILRGDHVVYQVDVKNVLKPDLQSWVVLKRYMEFFELDTAIREAVSAQYPHMLARLPPLPARESKALVNHLDETFIERRRVLLESYLQVLISLPTVRSLVVLLQFLGV